MSSSPNLWLMLYISPSSIFIYFLILWVYIRKNYDLLSLVWFYHVVVHKVSVAAFDLKH
jgi:hypothetical protein